MYIILLKLKNELLDKREVYLRIKVRPSSAKTEIKDILVDKNGETIKINIAAPPEKGKANQELVKFLASEFAVLKNNVRILSGAQDRIKLIKITK